MVDGVADVAGVVGDDVEEVVALGDAAVDGDLAWSSSGGAGAHEALRVERVPQATDAGGEIRGGRPVSSVLRPS